MPKGRRALVFRKAEWSSKNGVNPYQIPTTIEEAIGVQGAPMSMVDAYWDVNPYFSSDYKEFSENCQRCVFAYELRRRGYDVEALPTYKSDVMPYNGMWTKTLAGMKADIVGSRKGIDATIDGIKKQMSQYGEGSRAILRIQWAGHNSGHVVNVEYKNGRTYVFDAQNNRQSTGDAYLRKMLPYATLSRTELYRTDDKPMTDQIRYMVKRK